MLTRYTKQFVQYLRKNSAVSALEYAIMVGVIAVAISAAMVTFSESMKDALKDVGDKVKAASVSSGVST